MKPDTSTSTNTSIIRKTSLSIRAKSTKKISIKAISANPKNMRGQSMTKRAGSS